MREKATGFMTPSGYGTPNTKVLLLFVGYCLDHPSLLVFLPPPLVVLSFLLSDSCFSLFLWGSLFRNPKEPSHLEGSSVRQAQGSHIRPLLCYIDLGCGRP